VSNSGTWRDGKCAAKGTEHRRHYKYAFVLKIANSCGVSSEASEKEEMSRSRLSIKHGPKASGQKQKHTVVLLKGLRWYE